MIEMRVLLLREGEQWVSQALEHDICAQGPDLPTVQRRFDLTVDAECEAGNGSLDHIGPAPRFFFDLWEQRTGMFQPADGEDRPPYQIAMVA